MPTNCPQHPAKGAERAPDGIGRVHGAPSKVEGVRQILVQDPIDLPCADTVGKEGGHHRARAAPHVDVEAAAGAVETLLERGQSAHFVHAADYPSTGQGEPEPRTSTRPPAGEGALYDLHQ